MLPKTHADAEGKAQIRNNVERLVDLKGVPSDLGILLRNPRETFDLFIVQQGERKVWVGFKPDSSCLP